MYDCILVPTDGSEEGERAVEHAIDLAATHDASLVAVYVVNTAGYAGLPMETSMEGVDHMLRDEGARALGRVVDLADERGVPVERRLVDGSPSKRIVAVAEEADCDLVVMGTHGRGGIDRLLLGSVAERVVRESPVPVLTVRVGEDVEDESPAAEDAAARGGDADAPEDAPAREGDSDAAESADATE
jgi:nucleotide-binding universal stress UspA family protein